MVGKTLASKDVSNDEIKGKTSEMLQMKIILAQ